MTSVENRFDDNDGYSSFTIPPYVEFIDIEVNGAEGGSGSDPDNIEPPGQGGEGGYIDREKLPVTAGDVFNPWAGDSGGNAYGTGSGGGGGSGWYDGGKGADGNSEPSESGDTTHRSGGGGGGGAATVIFGPGGSPILVAEGGGGGAGSRDDGGTYAYGGGGGGGARGGEAGSGTVDGADPAEDGEGSGNGGDGGDSLSDDGNPGGTDATIAFDTAIVGGSNSYDGEIIIYHTDRVENLTSSPSGDNIDLTWTPATDANSQIIYRSQSPGTNTGDYNQIDTLGSNQSSYSDNNIEDGEQYYYRIENANSYDNRLSTETTSVSTLLAAANVTAYESDQSQATVEWDNQDDSTDGQIVIEQSNDGGNSWSQVGSVTVGTETFVHDTTPGSYQYRIIRETDHATAVSASTSITVFDPGAEINTNDNAVRDTDPDENNLTQP